jgi:hypothetical protein
MQLLLTGIRTWLGPSSEFGGFGLIPWPGERKRPEFFYTFMTRQHVYSSKFLTGLFLAIQHLRIISEHKHLR